MERQNSIAAISSCTDSPLSVTASVISVLTFTYALILTAVIFYKRAKNSRKQAERLQEASRKYQIFHHRFEFIVYIATTIYRRSASAQIFRQMAVLRGKIDTANKNLRSIEAQFFLRKKSAWRFLRVYTIAAARPDRMDAALDEFERLFETLVLYANAVESWLDALLSYVCVALSELQSSWLTISQGPKRTGQGSKTTFRCDPWKARPS